MSFIWPGMLVFLAALPVCVWLYVRVQRQRRHAVASNFGNARALNSNARSLTVRRHIPAVLFFTSLLVLVIALARPQTEISLPRVEGTVMLVFDVSGSMAATDVEPSRLEAARATARDFILSQPETVQIGIVSFSGSGFAVQNPTNDANLLLAAINRLKPQTGTSLGHGIAAALQAIAVDAGLAAPLQEPSPVAEPTQALQGQEQGDGAAASLLGQLPDGEYPPSVIVLLSDGENNSGFDPLQAAQAAAERSVRVDALGFGTTSGTDLELDGFTVHTVLDEGTLQQITLVAGGEYYHPQSVSDPQAVYKNLTPKLVVKPEKMEITAVLVGASTLFLAAGALLSLLWFNRLP